MRDNVSRLGRMLMGFPLSTSTIYTANKGNVTGASVKLGGHNAATVYIVAGTWTDGTHTFTINEAVDSSGSAGSFTAVSAANLLTWQATSTTDNTPTRLGYQQPAVISSAATALSQRIGYLGNLDWVNISVVASGSTGALYDVLWILGEPRLMPDNFA